jgi:methylmalonyl-CoA mutase C-terminal domain/subunit
VALIKVVISKMGFDAHYRGAMMVARHLVQRGMEVVYIGNRMPEEIVRTVVDEDAQVLGLSSLSGNHMVMVPRILSLLRQEGAERVKVLLGGVVPTEDQKALLSQGVAAIFGTGSSLDAIADWIEAAVGHGPDAVHA